MKTEAVELFDAFRGEWTMEKAESLWQTLEGLAKKAVRAETDERIADKVDVQVEKVVFREMKDVATKGDLVKLETKLEAKMDKLDGKVDSMFKWMVTGFIAILLAIVAMMAATRPASVAPAPQPTSVSPTPSPNP